MKIITNKHKEAIEALRKAWLIKGISPTYHALQQEKLKENWPVLYEAIIKIIKLG